MMFSNHEMTLTDVHCHVSLMNYHELVYCFRKKGKGPAISEKANISGTDAERGGS